jgi:hypothetical protein
MLSALSHVMMLAEVSKEVEAKTIQVVDDVLAGGVREC